MTLATDFFECMSIAFAGVIDPVVALLFGLGLVITLRDIFN